MGSKDDLIFTIVDVLNHRLSEPVRIDFSARLQQEPELARRVENLQSQNEELRKIGSAILTEELPGTLKAFMQQARQRSKCCPGIDSQERSDTTASDPSPGASHSRRQVFAQPA